MERQWMELQERYRYPLITGRGSEGADAAARVEGEAGLAGEGAVTGGADPGLRGVILLCAGAAGAAWPVLASGRLMGLHVAREVVGPRKARKAHGALKGLLAGVGPDVAREVAVPREARPARAAHKRLLSRSVRLQVLLELHGRPKHGPALAAGVLPVASHDHWQVRRHGQGHGHTHANRHRC